MLLTINQCCCVILVVYRLLSPRLIMMMTMMMINDERTNTPFCVSNVSDGERVDSSTHTCYPMLLWALLLVYHLSLCLMMMMMMINGERTNTPFCVSNVSGGERGKSESVRIIVVVLLTKSYLPIYIERAHNVSSVINEF